MRLFLILLVLCTGSLARAQSVQVTSGEHDGFSRLVLTFPATTDWQFGRTEAGYKLVTNDKNPSYNLSDVYRRLSRKRLSAIFTDPADGALHLGVSCLCHAIPFEFRQDQLVIDIRDGAAPEGSSFELSLEGSQPPPLGPRPVLRPKPRPQTDTLPKGFDPLNWRLATAEAARMSQRPDLPIMADETAMQTMRAALLWELSQGASKGLVEVRKPVPAIGSNDQTISPVQINIGPNIDPEASKRQPDQMLNDGSACFSDEDLAIADWARPGLVSAEIGAVRSGLLGEFDQPDVPAVSAAARYLLYLGFGAETRQLLRGLEVQTTQTPLWEEMAHILELEATDTPIFQHMESCDTAAALWAVLAEKPHQTTSGVNIPAVLRSFSALPLHLRKHLGPELGSRFLAAGDLSTSRAIRDAILRSRDGPEGGVDLLSARLEIASGNEETGKDRLEALRHNSGQEAIEASIALAELEFADGGEVSADITTSLEAFLHEARSGDGMPELQKALALAYASQNRFGLAFALIPLDTAAASDLWQRLALYGSNSALVEYAILDEHQTVPPLGQTTTQRLAERLAGLGFTQAALNWLDEKPDKAGRATEKTGLLRAEIAISERDGRRALREIAGMDSEEADLLRARALTLLQDDTAASSYAKTTSKPEWVVSARQRQSWSELASLSPDQPWSGALGLIGLSEPALVRDPEGNPSLTGPLTQARSVLTESNAARAILQELLDHTKVINSPE